MSIPTGPRTTEETGGRTSARLTGFERELRDILRCRGARESMASVWITTEVHFAEGLRCRPFADARRTSPCTSSSPDRSTRHFSELRLRANVNTRAGFFFYGPRVASAVTT